MSEQKLENILIEWELLRQEGRSPSVAELCVDCPELAEEAERRLKELQGTDWMLDDPVRDARDKPLHESFSKFMGAIGQSSETNVAPLAPQTEPPSDDAHIQLDLSLESVRAPLADLGFRLDLELGRGGFGVVYKAYDTKLQRPVAIKIPLIHKRDNRERYLREARVAAKVEAPGLVPILQIEELPDGSPVVIQKLIEGDTLTKKLKQGPFGPAQAVAIVGQLCSAMERMHELGFVHRDLKPNNILFDQDDNPWIADFGLTVGDDVAEQSHTLIRQIAGTPSYMSPEQLAGNLSRLDGRSDIWALGIILYECLTGKRPFRAASRSELESQIKEHDPRPISQCAAELDERFDAIFRRCCAKRPEDRYSSVGELAKELRVAGQELSPPSPGLAVAYASSKHARWAWIGIPLVLAVIAVAGFQWSRDRTAVVTNGDRNASVVASDTSAAEVQTIELAPGDHQRVLEFDTDAIVRGIGEAGQIRLLVGRRPAIRVMAGANVTIENISLGHAEGAGETNLVEVESGALEMSECIIDASRLNGIRAVRAERLRLTKCQLSSVDHPAVFASQCNDVEFTDCHFSMDDAPSGVTGRIPVALQLKQSPGRVRGCEFRGAGVTGVEWSNVAGEVAIENCLFQELHVGAAVFECESTTIGGTDGCEFEGCQTGISLVACGRATIRKVQFDAVDAVDSRAIKIDRCNSDVILEDATINTYRDGLQVRGCGVQASDVTIKGCAGSGIALLDGADLTLRNSRVLNCRDFGLQLENAKATLERVEFERCQVAGVVVDGGQQALQLNGCKVAECPVGLILLSGEATLRSSDFIGHDTPVLLSRKHLLGHPVSGDTPLVLHVDSGLIDGRLHQIHLLSPGTVHWSGVRFSDSSGSVARARVISAGDDLVLEFPDEGTAVARHSN